MRWKSKRKIIWESKFRFVELFGDAVANPMKWPVKKLKDLSVQINSGNTPKGGDILMAKTGRINTENIRTMTGNNPGTYSRV